MPLAVGTYFSVVVGSDMLKVLCLCVIRDYQSTINQSQIWYKKYVFNCGWDPNYTFITLINYAFITILRAFYFLHKS